MYCIKVWLIVVMQELGKEKKNLQGWNNDQWRIVGGVEMIDTVT